MTLVGLAHYQQFVNSAQLALDIDDAQRAGFLSGVKVNRRLCRYTLRCGQRYGLVPASLELRWLLLTSTAVPCHQREKLTLSRGGRRADSDSVHGDAAS